MDQGDFYLVQFVGVPSYSLIKPKFITTERKAVCSSLYNNALRYNGTTQRSFKDLVVK